MDVAVPTNAAENPDERRAGLDVGRVYEAALPQLRRIAAGMGLPQADAEDALHDSYVALLQNLDRLDEAENARRWLVRVVVNRCRLHHRQRKRRDLPMRGRRVADVGSAAVQADEAELVRASLRELDADELAVLVLRYFCDLNATEVAEILSVPASTVRSQLRRARMKLAVRLSEKGLVDDGT